MFAIIRELKNGITTIINYSQSHDDCLKLLRNLEPSDKKYVFDRKILTIDEYEITGYESTYDKTEKIYTATYRIINIINLMDLCTKMILINEKRKFVEEYVAKNEKYYLITECIKNESNDNLEEIYDILKNNNTDIDSKNDNILICCALYCQETGDIDKMKKYYLSAINNDNSIAMCYLGEYYEEINDHKNMMHYYLMSVEKDNSDAMNNLGCFYEKVKAYNNMKEYFLKAIKKDNVRAMNNLAYFYDNMMRKKIRHDYDAYYEDYEDYGDNEKDYDNIKKYFLMAIEKGNVGAMNGLGSHYQLIKDYENMKKYYQMAINKGDSNAMNRLASYYYITKDYDNMKKYYLMAIAKGNSKAMKNLGYYYEGMKDYDNMKKYYMMAIGKGNSDAMDLMVSYCKR